MATQTEVDTQFHWATRLGRGLHPEKPYETTKTPICDPRRYAADTAK